MRLKYKVLASTALAATLLTGTALAANVYPQAGLAYYSKEGAAQTPSTTVVNLPTITVDWQAQYAVGDVVPAPYQTTL